MGSAVRSDSSAARTRALLSSLHSLHTPCSLSLSLSLSSPRTPHLALSSPHSLSCCRLVLAPACLRACVFSLALPHCRSLSVNHSLLCHKDNSFWHFRTCVCVCWCCFFSCSAENESKFVVFCVYAPLWLAIRAVFRSVAVPSTAVGKPQSSAAVAVAAIAAEAATSRSEPSMFK